MRSIVILPIALLSMQTVISAQETLREQVRSLPAGEEMSITISSMIPMADVPSLLRQSDVVVDGIVDRGVIALTSDGRLVATTYAIRVLRILHERGKNPTLPSQPPPVVYVRQIGGDVQIDGHVVHVLNRQAPRLEPGAQVILFLIRSPRDSRVYESVNGPYGVFAISNGRVKPDASATLSIRELYDGLELSAFEDILHTSVAP